MNVSVELLSSSMVEHIESELLDALAQNRPASRLDPLHVTARQDDELLGGLVGGVSYGWLHVEMLWVRDAHRGRGIGAAIMGCAEQAARSRGCHGAWLDTSSERAQRFYAELGYEVFGLLENRCGEQPAGHRRWFLQKRLA